MVMQIKLIVVVVVVAISFNGKYNELTISHGQKHFSLEPGSA